MKNNLVGFRESLLVLIFGILLFNLTAPAQSVIATQGDLISTGNILYSFTVGEAIIGTVNNADILFSQGFQQPDKLIVDIQEPNHDLYLKAYPNPTNDALKVMYEGSNPHFDLHDCTGQLLPLTTLKRSEKQIEFSFSRYPAGIYLLRAEGESGVTIGYIRIVKQ